MNEPFVATKITDKVYWVGAVDWNLRDFHGYATERGTSYNAFLIVDEKITLIDTVKKPLLSEMMSRIASVVDPERIDYIVSNHSEMDHTGSLPAVMELVKPEKVFASANGLKALKAHFHLDDDVITVVKDGESLALGGSNLSFVETRMLHWPDSMFTFLDDGGVLFSQDGFGMHLASSERFADELDESVLNYEAAKYFANILLPYSPLVTKLLGKLDLPVKIIAPDHGPAYRENLDWILSRYAQWAEQKPSNKVVITFDTMWGSTEVMAQAIADGVLEGGGSPVVMGLKSQHRSDIALALLGAGAFIVGSPTINNQMFPTVADLLTYLRGLRPKNLIGGAFGSYGWSGESIKQIDAILDEMKIARPVESVKAIYVPDKETLLACRAFGKELAVHLGKI